MTIALIGNQNCGKTTLFNQLTGSSAHVGNFPGVTVEQKSGTLKGHSDVTIVDLPGIYSLSPYTEEEILTRDFLLTQNVSGIINITDATNLERNLYLTLQLLELKIPTVVALNMFDEVVKNKGTIDIDGLKNVLGVPVVPIAAVKNQGVAELTDKIILVSKLRTRPAKIDFCTGAVHRAVHAISHIIEDHAQAANIPERFAAIKLVDGDKYIEEFLKLGGNELETIEHTVKEMESELKLDREAALADMRYKFIEKYCQKCITKPHESAEYKRSIKIDTVLTHKYFALPFFLGIIVLIFALTFGVIGNNLGNLTVSLIDFLTEKTSDFLTSRNINENVHSLVIDGIFAGVGAVVGFLPVILTLFFLLSLLEDSGYMARIAFVMDKPMRKIGLSGKSFVPLLMGFGCTVPAIMATRTLSSSRDRVLTILLLPFMSCGAKVPIYILFVSAFFPDHTFLVMLCLYVMGIVCAVAIASLLKATSFKGEPVPFVMELPNYRLPAFKSTVQLMWEKAKDFLQKAFSVILIASIVIWFLQSYDIMLNPVDSSENSILALIGQSLAPFFAPLGLNDWRIPTALITGFMAKETVVSTLAVLIQDGSLATLFTPVTAISFLVFSLIYTPCIAAVATAYKEFRKTAVSYLVFQTLLAWILAFIAYTILA